MDNTEYSILADLQSAENQRKKREQLAMEMMGYDGFLNSMLTPEERAHAKGELTQAETAEHDQRQAAIDDTSRMIAQQQEAAQRAIELTERQLRQAEEALDEIHKRATKTADGQAVYLTADGTKAYYEDGRQMTAHEIAGVNWNSDAPTWEEHQQLAADFTNAKKAHDDAKAYADRVDYYGKRLQTGDLTAEELADIRTDLDAIPPSVHEAQAASSPPAFTDGLTGNFQQAASLQLTTSELANAQATQKKPDSKPGFGIN